MKNEQQKNNNIILAHLKQIEGRKILYDKKCTEQKGLPWTIITLWTGLALLSSVPVITESTTTRVKTVMHAMFKQLSETDMVCWRILLFGKQFLFFVDLFMLLFLLLWKRKRNVVVHNVSLHWIFLLQLLYVHLLFRENLNTFQIYFICSRKEEFYKFSIYIKLTFFPAYWKHCVKMGDTGDMGSRGKNDKNQMMVKPMQMMRRSQSPTSITIARIGFLTF